ncbi:MAG: maleylpyruvate isomerase [Myxococcota bacterium]
MRLALHGYWRSSCSWRVRIALEHKGLDYEYVAVHLVQDGGVQHSEAHRAINPMRQVPVLVADGVPMGQSMAILEYLEETAPDQPLLPSDPVQRARVRQIAETINSGIQPLQNLAVIQKLRSDASLDKAAVQAWCRDWITRGFVAVEALVKAHGAAYCVGDTVSLADVCLVPQLYNGRRFDVDLSAFPTLLQVEARLNELPAFVAAAPDQQPDAG